MRNIFFPAIGLSGRFCAAGANFAIIKNKIQVRCLLHSTDSRILQVQLCKIKKTMDDVRVLNASRCLTAQTLMKIAHWEL